MKHLPKDVAHLQSPRCKPFPRCPLGNIPRGEIAVRRAAQTSKYVYKTIEVCSRDGRPERDLARCIISALENGVAQLVKRQTTLTDCLAEFTRKLKVVFTGQDTIVNKLLNVSPRHVELSNATWMHILHESGRLAADATVPQVEIPRFPSLQPLKDHSRRTPKHFPGHLRLTTALFLDCCNPVPL